MTAAHSPWVEEEFSEVDSLIRVALSGEDDVGLTASVLDMHRSPREQRRLHIHKNNNTSSTHQSQLLKLTDDCVQLRTTFDVSRMSSER